MAKKISVRLSNKLSGMLRAAVADMQAVRKDKRYRLNMSNWHRPVGYAGRKKCEVCMAGAVLALRGTNVTAADEVSFSWENTGVTPLTLKKMRAINYMRTGEMLSAARDMGLIESLNEEQRQALVSTRNKIRGNPEWNFTVAPDKTYLEVADILAEAGL